MPKPEDETFVRCVPDALDECRLDVFLAAQPEIGARSSAKRLVKLGAVSVDGQVLKPGSSLAAGQEVAFRLIPETFDDNDAAPFPDTLEILFEDAYILVINKKPGMSSHPPNAQRRNVPTVSGLALAHFGELPTVSGEDRPGIVHRLDKDTTGVMVLAKTDEASHFLKAQFKARKVKKEYRCISYGEPRFDSDWIERALTQNPKQGDRMIVANEGEGKASATFYKVVERFGEFTHFSCQPRTGRTHQIRVHMTSIGHSLVGDGVYRSRNAQRRTLPEGCPEAVRHCLHAFKLSFQHPRTHEDVEFEAPMPDDMEQILAWMRANSS